MKGLYYVMYDDGETLHFHSLGFKFYITAFLCLRRFPIKEGLCIVKIYK